ncbi:MAG TPA: hypothetical protein VMW14_02480 [Candidatus Paceibacterota bacterium]|nr:hypothetical protein [Candidatus Paceibacterota bacterium]
MPSLVIVSAFTASIELIVVYSFPYKPTDRFRVMMAVVVANAITAFAGFLF